MYRDPVSLVLVSTTVKTEISLPLTCSHVLCGYCPAVRGDRVWVALRVQADSTWHGVLGGTQVCTPRPRCQELHVSYAYLIGI